MLHIPKINDYLKILTDEGVKDCVNLNFSEYFKTIMEKKNLRKVTKSLHIFLRKPDKVEKHVESDYSDYCVHHYNVEILNLFNLELQLINTKPVIKNKLQEMLNELKMFKVQTILVLGYKKRNDRKIFHSSAKLIASDSDIHEAFKFMYQSIMSKIKNYGSEDCIVLNVIIKHRIKIFECYYMEKNWK